MEEIKATKHDQGKPDLTTVPLSAMVEIAAAMSYGAKKYGKYNYYKGHTTSQLIAACLRHVYAHLEGEDTDLESGNSHISHAMACLVMLTQQIKLGTHKDDRYGKQ